MKKFGSVFHQIPIKKAEPKKIFSFFEKSAKKQLTNLFIFSIINKLF